MIVSTFSDSKVETTASESFVWQNDFDIVFLGLLLLFLLEFPFFLDKELFLVILQLFLQSFQFNAILLHGFFIVDDFFLHGCDLTLLLLQVFFVNGDHLFFLNGRLALEDFLKRFKLVFFRLKVFVPFFHLFSLLDETFLNRLYFCHEFISRGVRSLEFAPSVDIHWVLYFFRQGLDL